MKEKGFTLIELLAVILILGIIALIAIPVVTKLVEESRIKSFKETNQNISSAVESECATSQINGTGSIAGYTFTPDGASGDIGVKGKLPTGGSVVTDSSCNSIVYTTNDKYCAVKSANADEVTVGRLKDGQCSIVMNDDNYCTTDSNPGTLGGTGTESDPYLIDSIEDLMAFRQMQMADPNQFTSKTLKLNTNIDFKNECSYANSNNTTYGDINEDGTVDGLLTELTTGKGFDPLGPSTADSWAGYQGNFDGGNHYISNLYINRPSESSNALFGNIYSTAGTQSFKNVNIINSNVIGDSQNALLVAKTSGYDILSFDNISVMGNVKGSGHTSLLLGYCSGNPDDTNSFSNIRTLGNVSVTSGSYNSGVIAYSTGGATFKNIVNSATVEAVYATGGIFGKVEYATISNVYNYGNVTDIGSNNSTGGIIGYTNGYNITLQNAYNYGTVTGNRSVGGVIGWNGGGTSPATVLTNLNNYGDVKYKSFGTSSSNEYFGGVAGYIGAGTLTTATNYGDIYGVNRTGGIVGNAYSLSITNAANYGSIYGQYAIGGIAGSSEQNSGVGSTLTNVFNIGNIITKSFETAGNSSLAGGITGYTGDTTITNAYSTGNIAVESNNGMWSYIGGIVGRVQSYSTPVSIVNAYAKTNIEVTNNYASASNGFFGGIVGYGYSESSLTNIYYTGNITTNLSTKTVGTIIASGTKTLTNVYYNDANIANFNVIDGVAVNNSSVNSSWFNNPLTLGSAFNYSNGLYPRLYISGTTNLMPNQKEISL